MKLMLVYHAGATRQIDRLCRTLVERGGVELTLVAPERLRTERVYAPSGWLVADARGSGDAYRLVPIPLKNPANYPDGFDRDALRSIIRETKADVIHVLDEPISGYLLQVVQLARTSSRRSRILFYGWDNVPLRLGRRTRLIWRIAWSQMAGGAAANSEALEHLRAAGFPPGRLLERIFWGVETDRFRPLEGDGVRASLGLDYPQLIGFAGRLLPEKGLPVLLAALQRLPDSVHGAIVGNGPMRAELELLASVPSLAGRVHFRDTVGPELLVRYMNSLDVLILPSLTTPRWKEQYGRVLAEAMAVGTPIVGSDSGAIPEVVENAGLIVPEGDPKALADAIALILNDSALRDRLRRAGLRRADRELSIDAMTGRLLALYGRVIAPKHPTVAGS